MRRFLDVDSVSEKIFFSPSHFPHATGPDFLCSLSAVRHCRLHLPEGCPLRFRIRALYAPEISCLRSRSASSCSLPIGQIRWVALITGYPFLLLYAALIYWLFSRKRDLMALPLCGGRVLHPFSRASRIRSRSRRPVAVPSDRFSARRALGAGLRADDRSLLLFRMQHGKSVFRDFDSADVSVGLSLLSGIVYGAKLVMPAGRSLPVWNYLAVAALFALPLSSSTASSGAGFSPARTSGPRSRFICFVWRPWASSLRCVTTRRH